MMDLIRSFIQEKSTISIIILFYYLIFSITFFWKAKIKPNPSNESAFSKEDSVSLKGMAALMIFLAHTKSFLASYGSDNSLLIPFSVFGGVGVLLFFFLSGYGIGKGYSQKKPSVAFWKKRIFNIFVPACIISAIFQTVILLISKGSIKTFILEMFGGQWYIDVIMLCYIGFFISWIIAKKKNAILLIFVAVFCFAFATMFYLLGFNPRWYNGIMLFPLGLFFAVYEKEILNIPKNVHIIAAITSVFLFILSGALFTMLKGNLLGDLIKTVSGIALAIFSFEVFRIVKASNSVNVYLGKRSLYVYLCHLWLIKVLESLINSNSWLASHIIVDFCALLVGSVVITEIFYRIFLIMQKK